MLTNRSSSVLGNVLSIDKSFPKRTASEIIESLKSLLFTRWLFLNRNALPKSLNCMEESMRLTPQRLISACPFSDRRIAEPQSQEYETTRRLTSSLRFQYSTESPILRYIMSISWTGSHTNHLHAMCLIEGILTLQDSMKSIARKHSSLFVRSFILIMRLRAGLTLRKETTMSSVTILFDSMARGIRRIILHLSGALYTTRQILDEPSLTIQTSSILELKTMLSFINTGSRSNYFSNGSNSISASKLFGENPRIQSVFRYILPSSHIASLVSSNMTCKSVVPSWK